MKLKMIMYIISAIITGFIILPNVYAEQEENRYLGIISEISENGNYIEVGNRQFIVLTVFIDDGTTEKPVTGSTYNLKSGSVIEVVHNGPYKNFKQAKEVILFTGKKKEMVLMEMKREGLLRMYNLEALGIKLPIPQ